MCTRTQGKEQWPPQETEPDLTVSIWGSPMETWVSSGLPWRPSVWHKPSQRRSALALPQSCQVGDPQAGEQLHQSSFTAVKVLVPTTDLCPFLIRWLGFLCVIYYISPSCILDINPLLDIICKYFLWFSWLPLYDFLFSAETFLFGVYLFILLLLPLHLGADPSFVFLEVAHCKESSSLYDLDKIQGCPPVCLWNDLQFVFSVW